MSEATEVAAAAASRDPAVGLAAVASLRRLLESLEELQVGNARTQGWSWQQIADALVPFVRAIVPTVDLEGGRVVLNPPEGLLDLP